MTSWSPPAWGWVIAGESGRELGASANGRWEVAPWEPLSCGQRGGVSPELCLGQVTATWKEAGEDQVCRSGHLMAPWRLPQLSWPRWL